MPSLKVFVLPMHLSHLSLQSGLKESIVSVNKTRIGCGKLHPSKFQNQYNEESCIDFEILEVYSAGQKKHYTIQKCSHTI